MSGEKRDFSSAAAAWDREPARLRLAEDVVGAVAAEVWFDPSMDVLDFGCGTGLVTLRLQPFVRSVTGVDSAPGMLEVLRGKIAAQGLQNVTTRLVDLDKGDRLEGSYRLVVSSMTFHHVRDTATLLAELARVLEPGGTLCVADLDPDDGQFHGDPTGVFHHGFDRTALQSAFAAAGLENVRDRTASRITKPGADGVPREFTVFLMTGETPRD